MQTLKREYFPLQPGQRVLDLGCGEGRHVIAAHAIDGVDAVGVDLSASDLATAAQRQREFVDGGEGSALFSLLVGDALRLPFPSATFDAVICSEVLEHIPDWRAALTEIERVLKPGGLFCASVPRAWPEQICWWLSREYHDVPGGHLRIFSRPELRGAVIDRGFECYREHGAHALHAPYWWLQCLFWKTRDTNWLIRQYHRFLVWDMMEQPAVTRALERALNPVLGKSIVMYFRKSAS